MGGGGDAEAELERIQTQILRRISELEISLHLPDASASAATISNDESDTEARLSSILRTHGVNDFAFKKVPSDYYDWPLEARRDALAAASVDHLCKSIVLVVFLSISLRLFLVCICLLFFFFGLGFLVSRVEMWKARSFLCKNANLKKKCGLVVC